MEQVDGETYATVQSLFNENVRHAMFFFFFFGGGAFSVLTTIANIRSWRVFDFWLIALAAVIYILGVIAFTASVNLPLNDITEGWNPQNVPVDWSSIRDQWNQANAIRVWTSGSAFVLSVVALVCKAMVSTSPIQ